MADETPNPTEPAAGVPSISPGAHPLPNAGTPVDSPPAPSEPFGPTTGISHPIPIPQKAAEWESGFQNEHGPRPSRWEAWISAPFQEGLQQSISGSLLKFLGEETPKNNINLSPDEANKLYPGRPVPYTTPVNQSVAAMEYQDRQKHKELDDWLSQRPMTTMGRITSTAAGFAGGLTDPLTFAVGMAAGGVSEMLMPEFAGVAGRVAAHYVSTLGGFSAIDAVQNIIEHRTGAKQKQLSEIVGENLVPAAIMTGIGLGLTGLARRFVNEGGGTSEVDTASIKKTVAAFEKDERPPLLEDQRKVLTERRAGISTPGGSPEARLAPTILTSPLQETQLYGATHSDGSPLNHQHGLGPGFQVTDSYDVANNGVSRSTDTPGQIHEAKLAENSKLLDLEQTGSQDYGSENSLIKAIEAKTGLPLENAGSSGETLKDIITNLGDWAGVDIGDGKTVPEDILKQIQDIAREKGYAGYQFNGESLDGTATNRQAHLFDPTSASITKSYDANPGTTPQIQPPEMQQALKGGQPAQDFNPAIEKAKSPFYSPEVEKLVHEFRKGKVFDPYSPEVVAETQKDIEQYKEQLTTLAKESPSAQEALDMIKKQEIHDERMKDLARKIAECGSGGGL